MRFLFLRVGRPLRFFKRIRIGFRLFKQSLSTIVFDHHRYFLFCALLALVQFSRIELTSLIDPQFSISYAVTESLMGQSFFTILFSRPHHFRSLYDIGDIGFKVLFFFIELFLSFTILGAVSYYTFYLKKESSLQSIIYSLSQWKKIGIWVSLELVILFLTSLLGIIGDFLEFVWSLSTALVIPLIMFQQSSMIMIIKNTFLFFKQRFANIIGIETVTESLFIFLTFLFYYIYQNQQTFTFSFLQSTKLHALTLVGLFYLNAVAAVTEVITLTLLYKVIVPQKFSLKNLVE